MNHPGLRRLRQERPHRYRTLAGDIDHVRTQQLERVFVLPFDQTPYRFQRQIRAHYMISRCNSKLVIAGNM
jgi:hypothetical protein